MTEALFKIEKRVKGIKGGQLSEPGTAGQDNDNPNSRSGNSSKSLKDRIKILESELQRAREESFSAGYEEGKSSALKEAQRRIEVVGIEMRALELKYLEAIENIEGPLLDIACKIAKQIIQKEIETMPSADQIIIDRLRKMLYEVVDQNKVMVEVNPAHLERLSSEDISQDLQIPGNMELNFVAGENLQEGEAIVNTEDFHIDGTFANSAENMKDRLMNEGMSND